MPGFASDNYAGAHPEVMRAVAATAEAHVPAYGADPWTERAGEVLRGHFGSGARTALVFNGTGANVVGLQLLVRPWQYVLCASTAHINTDECGAPERWLGSKLLDVATPDGKLTPEIVTAAVAGRGDEHRVQPGAVSVTQSTELGTAYRPHELAALADCAHGLGMALHMDGARLSNAAAHFGVSLRELTTDVGVDVLSLGCTKNGALGAEAVVVLGDRSADDLPFARKQAAQLPSKMRFLAAQVLALYEGDLWHANASHANAMATRLAAAVRDLPGVTVTQPVQANAVFAVLAPKAVAQLRTRYAFYDWNSVTGEVRWMCAWDTTPGDVDAFAADVARAVASS